MKRYNEAIEIFNRGLKINPNDAGCLYNKGLLLELMGRQTEAGKYISMAQAKDPTYSGGLIIKDQLLPQI
jgi:tetratricopeptide (TPR) repeat protein